MFLRKDGHESQQDPSKKGSSVSEVDGGVTIAPVPVTLGEDITIQYRGQLSGEQQLYLHMGYGADSQWKYVSDMPMEKIGTMWKTTFEVKDDSRLHFCFKDSTSNWDNNNGNNWNLQVHTGKQIH
jgi:hypothetical protein